MILRQVALCDTSSTRAKGLMFTEILGDECCTFLFDSPTRLSFWGKNTPQDLWLNCVSDGLVTESLRVLSGCETPVVSDGEYRLAFESLGSVLGGSVEFSPGFVEVSRC